MKKIFTLVSLAFAIAAGLSSCSLIGYGIGSVIDNGHAHDTVAIFTDVSSYTGQAAQIHYPDSSVRSAIFQEYSDEPADTYRKRYDEFAAADSSNPTAIGFGENVVGEYYASPGFVQKKRGLFNGYYPEGILFADDKMRLRSFDSLFTSKHLSKAALQKSFESNSVPIRATLKFKTSENSFTLTNRDFQNVMILPHSANARWTGLGIGAAFDVVFIALLVNYVAHICVACNY